jgi:hypothetical protein
MYVKKPYFTGFLVIDTATANYGFFTYMSLCLNAFLLADADLTRAKVFFSSRMPRMAAWFAGDPALVSTPASSPRALRVLQTIALLCWLAASALGGLTRFTDGVVTQPWLLSAQQRLQPWRVANVYHLFGQITRERFEPEFQALHESEWKAYAMHYKPGPVDRSPPLVAPHQPRVDFRLWFYGLSFSRGTPRFVDTLLQRLCHAPEHVQPLFVERLPRNPEAVRIVFHRYRYSTPEQRAQTGAVWMREEVGSTHPLRCH